MQCRTGSTVPFHEDFLAPFGISILAIQLIIIRLAILHALNIGTWSLKVGLSRLVPASWH